MAYRVRETPRYRATLVVVLCVVLSLVDVSDAGRGGFGGRSGGFGRGTGSKSSGSKSGGWGVFSSKPAPKPAPAPSPPKPAPRPNTANTALSYGPGYGAAKPSAPVGNAPQPAKPGWNVDQGASGASGANKPIGWNVNNQGSNPVPPPSHVSGVNSAAKPPPYSQYPQHAPPPQYTPHGGAPYPNQGAPPAYPGYGARPGQAQPPPYSYNPQYGHTSMSGGHPPAGYPQQQYRPGGGYYNNPSPGYQGYHGAGYNPGGYGGGYSPGGYGGYGGGGGFGGGGFGAGSPFGYGGGGGGYGMYEKKRSFFSSPVATVGTVFAGLALWELLRNRNQYKVYTVNHVYTDNRPNSFTQLANESKVEPGNTYIITPNNVACNVTEMKAESGSVFSLSCDTKEAFNATVVLPGNATAVIPCTATSAAGDAKLQASCNGNVNVNETQLTPVKYDVLNDTQVFTDIYNYCNATMMEMIVNNATLNATLNALLGSLNETENATASGNATSAAANETSAANETLAKLPCAPPPPNLLPPNPYPYPPPYGYPYPPPGYPYPPPPGYPNMSYPYPYPYPYPPPPGYPNMTYPYPPPPGYPNMSYPYPPPPGYPEQVVASNQSADLSATQSSLSNAKISPSSAESPHQSALIHAAVFAVSFAFARVLCT